MQNHTSMCLSLLVHIHIVTVTGVECFGPFHRLFVFKFTYKFLLAFEVVQLLTSMEI